MTDINDALEQIGQMVDRDLNLSDFKQKKTKLKLDDLYNYDDIDAWAEWGQGELLELDEEERWDEIDGFRGDAFGRRARKWLQSGFPPIVIVETKEYTGIGDGRGRITVALGMDYKKPLPAIILTEKKQAMSRALAQIITAAALEIFR